jgi:hypothetical protein
MHKYSVQLRISGEGMDPARITQHLQLQPSQIRVAGQSAGNERVWRGSLWAFDGVTDGNAPLKEWASLEEGLLHLLDTLEPKKESIGVLANSAEVIWWCGHFQSSFDGGPTLSASLLQRLGDFGVPLFIDNYFSEGS